MKPCMFTFALCFFVSICFLQAQEKEETIKATDFSIPSSPAFTLLDVTPSKVTKPGFARDFKLDWIVKDQKVVSDIAIEAQAVWILFFDKVSASEFRKMDYLTKTLSTLNLSLGTAEKDNQKSLAFGTKLNLYRENDPMSDTAYHNKIRPRFDDLDKNLSKEIEEIAYRLEVETTLTKEQVENLIKEKVRLELEISKIDSKEKERIKTAREQFSNENWNASMLDAGGGLLFNYDSPAIDSLKFKNKGFGVWLNGSYGLGKTVLLTGLIKYIELDKKKNISYGANLRYGGAKANFFAEYVYEKLDETNKNTISYGGEYRINSKTILEFSLRTEYDKDMKLSNLIPTINLDWALAKDLF